MSQSLTLTTYFRARDKADRAFGPADYVAGFENGDGAPWGVAVPLEPDEVEKVVLGGVGFSVTMDTDGTLGVAAEGLGDAGADVLARSGPAASVPVDALVRDAVRPDVLAMDEDAQGDLETLRSRLESAVALVDDALARLKA